MPDQLPVDPIAQLKQSIALLEEQQGILGLDLSASVQPLRELLAHLEQAALQVVSNQSGGISATADRIDIGGDVVSRDKIESHNESVTAGSGGVALSGSTVYGGIQIGVPAERTLDDATALGHYLTHVVEANRRLARRCRRIQRDWLGMCSRDVGGV